MHTKSNNEYLQASSSANTASSHLYPFPPPHTQYIITFSSGIIFEANPRHYIISSMNTSLHISKR